MVVAGKSHNVRVNAAAGAVEWQLKTVVVSRGRRAEKAWYMSDPAAACGEGNKGV